MGNHRKKLFSLANLANSFETRRGYWIIAWQMALDHPFFGVGHDSYGDWFKSYRGEEQAFSNAAHNVFLDILSNTGFVGFASYLLIVGITLKSCFNVCFRTRYFDPIGSGLALSYVAYFLQSLISINQISLAVWGWVLSASVIAYDVAKNSNLKRVRESRSSSIRKKPSLKSKLLLAPIFIVGATFSLIPLSQDYQYRRALESANANQIIEATKQFPPNLFLYTNSSKLFMDNSLFYISRQMAEFAVELNPRSTQGWELILNNPSSSPKRVKYAKSELVRLDPNNTSYKSNQ